MPLTRSKALSTARAERLNTFRVFKIGHTARKRSKFDPKRRDEVKAVRHKRACLRCSLLKIKCSDDDICTTCDQLRFILHKHDKLTLSFSGCIRTRLQEVSIFEANLPPTSLSHSIFENSEVLALTVISLEFASQVTWDLDALVDDIVGWLNVPFLSETSKVGIMSSPQFLAIIKGSIEDSIGVKFQRMIYAISLAYTQPTASDKHQLSTGELYQIGSTAGHDLLQYLDERLKPQPLSQSSQTELRAMFLIVFGTILAVGYAIAEDLGPSREQKHHLEVMQNHLCQVLAHYLIYLGSQLRLPIAAGTNQFILEAASARWFKEGQFH